MKYFDQSFFRFTLGFVSILTLSFAVLFFVGQYALEDDVTTNIHDSVMTGK